jgi:hypothetical protein
VASCSVANLCGIARLQRRPRRSGRRCADAATRRPRRPTIGDQHRAAFPAGAHHQLLAAPEAGEAAGRVGGSRRVPRWGARGRRQRPDQPAETRQHRALVPCPQSAREDGRLLRRLAAMSNRPGTACLKGVVAIQLGVLSRCMQGQSRRIWQSRRSILRGRPSLPGGMHVYGPIRAGPIHERAEQIQ